MSWQGQMSTILRYLIDDVDSTSYKFSDERIETTLLVAAQLVTLEVDLTNTYTINVETCSLSPDPTETDTRDNAYKLSLLKRRRCYMGSQIRGVKQLYLIKDGPSAIDLRGVTGTLTVLYKDLSEKYEKLLLDYRTGNSVAGKFILGPYSPEAISQAEMPLDTGLADIFIKE